MAMPVASPDRTLDALADLRGPLRRMSLLSLVGLGFSLLFLAAFAFALGDRATRRGDGVVAAAFEWSWVGIPVLLHIWPILNLRTVATSLALFAAAPSDAAAAATLRAQRLYWRAAGISHLVIVLWILAVAAVHLATGAGEPPRASPALPDGPR